MTDTHSSPASDTPRPGRLTGALIRLFMRQATVERVENVGEGFRTITLAGPQFKNLPWALGQKVQIAFGPTLLTRTYTPIEWDGERGETRILGFAHGVGPGSDWVRNVQPGDECHVFGPRGSLDIGKASGPIMLFGDETSFGLACSIARQGVAKSVQCLFEVNDAELARAVLGAFDLKAELFERQPGDTHLINLEDRLAAFEKTNGTFVLTGKATSIQQVRRMLKTLNVPAARIMTRAYWAPGKTGLD